LLKGSPGKRPVRSPPEVAQEANNAKEELQRVAPELHRLGRLTVLDIGPLAAYCAAAARLRQAEEAIERMAKQDKRDHALTIKGSAGNQVTNPLLRIASTAMADVQRIGSAFGLTPNGQLRLLGRKPPPPAGKFDGLLGS
jgi:P27 family predicted phage terminase small subunit